MGTATSRTEREPTPDPWWPPPKRGTSRDASCETAAKGEDGERSTKFDVKSDGEGVNDEDRARKRREEMEAFKREMAKKREARHRAIATLQAELEGLRSEVAREKESRVRAEEECDGLREGRLNVELATEREARRRCEEELRLEREARKGCEEELRLEREARKGCEEEMAACKEQVHGLKEITNIGREMLRVREKQVKELKKKLKEVADLEASVPAELRAEYEVQMENTRKLRALYEERERASHLEHRRERERDAAKVVVLETHVRDLQADVEENVAVKQRLEEQILELEASLEAKTLELCDTKDELIASNTERKSITSQMQLINNLFSQVLLGPEIDLDRMTRLLQENHDLINDLTTTGDCNDVTALLLDIAGQADGEEGKERVEEDGHQVDIASNLSKVWRVLVELLSHHTQTNASSVDENDDSCYKSVDTPSGPKRVISVSQTFLRLKDLILEKNSLVKEVGKLRKLNGHLESRLDGQESRLSVVVTELKKTWGVVSKLRAQHRQLHTHEKILRHELQHKRAMLTELKQELERCREKWEEARQKNSQSEVDCMNLRREFAMRKTRQECHSAESGYEEDSPQSSDSMEEELEADEASQGNSLDTVVDLLDVSLNVDEDIQIEEVNLVLNPVEGSSDLESTTSPVFKVDDDPGDMLLECITSAEPAGYPGTAPEEIATQVTQAFFFGNSSAENISRFFETLNITTNESVGLLCGVTTSSELNEHKVVEVISDHVSEPGIDIEEIISCGSEVGILRSGDAADLPQLTIDASDFSSPSIEMEYVKETYCNGPEWEQPSSNEIEGKSTKYDGDSSEYARDPSIQETHSEELPDTPQVISPARKPSTDCASSAKYSLQPTTSRTPEEILEARAARLRRLEEQCKSLFHRMSQTSQRSDAISNKLEELHEQYGSEGVVCQKVDAEEGQSRVFVPEVTGTVNTTSPEVKEEVNHGEITATLIPNCTGRLREESRLEDETQQGAAAASGLQRSEARAERLKRLEEQCSTLVKRVALHTDRGSAMLVKVDELRGQYSRQGEVTSTPAEVPLTAPEEAPDPDATI